MERVSKYRVDDAWINCEMAYLKKRMKFDDSDAALTTETSVPILFALLEEIKARRESDTSGGVTMERVSDDILEGIINDQGNIIAGSWNAIHYLLVELQARRKAEKEHGHTDNSASEKDGAVETQERENEIDVFWNKIAMQYYNCPCILSLCPALDGDKCGFWEGTCAASLRKKYESIAGIPPKNAKEAVLPAPVKQVDGVDVKTWTVKQWFQKINEELDELKEAVGSPLIATPRELYSVTWSDFSDRAIEERCKKIAEEAADTITAITSMLEAMGIDEQQRQAAQKLVNEHNKERDRL